ncbi:alpha/beta fold hydrolase [uncultured Phycicoccus sp.]|uniref:alpha/beta fold hydrolase n=1 Tax=uncultured Phycicoccus sp. TaxID=661422 RepID=UPI00262116D6|nr:alpha/beta fold hydrolase [uncultured Phycicoccus sp.]
MPTALVNGAGLHYESRGEGPAILGIHGTPSSSALWLDAAARLAEHGRCIVYDRRGFPGSDPPAPGARLDLDDHVADAAALLHALTATPALVVGRSTGGLVALRLAQQHPGLVRGLVLLEPAVFPVHPAARHWGAELRERVVAAVAADASRAGEAVFVEALGQAGWDSLPGEVRAVMVAAGPAVLAELRGQGLDLSADPWAPDDATLGAIKVPTLLVAAQDSPEPLRAVVDRLAAALPRAEHGAAAGGHLIDPAHPLVLDFIDRHTR